MNPVQLEVYFVKQCQYGRNLSASTIKKDNFVSCGEVGIAVLSPLVTEDDRESSVFFPPRSTLLVNWHRVKIDTLRKREKKRERQSERGGEIERKQERKEDRKS